MTTILVSSFLFVTLVVCVVDYRYREISVWLLLLHGAISILMSMPHLFTSTVTALLVLILLSLLRLNAGLADLIGIPLLSAVFGYDGLLLAALTIMVTILWSAKRKEQTAPALTIAGLTAILFEFYELISV